MKIGIVSADDARAARLATAVEARGHDVLILEPGDPAPDGTAIVLIDLPGDRPAAGDALVAAAERRAAASHLPACPLLVPVGPPPSEAELEALLAGGADDYLTLSAGDALDEATLARGLAILERRVGRECAVARAAAVATEEEARHRAAEARLRAMIDQLPAVVYLDRSDDASTSLYMGPGVERLTGYTAAEFTTDPLLWHNILHPEDRAAAIAEHLRTNATGDPFRMEYRIIARDGRVVWILDEATLAIDDKGVTLWQGVWFDITERKEAEAAVRAANQRYRALIEQMPAVTYLAAADEHGSPLFVSPQVEKISGLPPSVWQAHPELWLERMHPDDRERVYANHLRCNETGEVFHEEYRLLHPDGHYVWIRDEARRIVGHDGRSTWQGVWVDITARKEAEEALRLSERRYRDLVEHSEGLILTHDLDGVLRSVNLAAARALGYEPVALIGKNLRHYLAPELAAGFDAYLDRVRTTAIVSGQLHVRTQHGDERIWSYHNVRTEEPDQEPYVIAHAHDITERVRAEAALRASETQIRVLLAAEQRAARELELLDRVRQALTRETDLDEVIRTVVEGLHEMFGYQLVSVYFVEEGELRLRHQRGYPDVIERIPLDRGICGRVARTGEPVLLSDARSDPTFLQAFDGVASEVCVPLKLGDGIAGILNLESTVPGGLGEDDLRLMLMVADSVSVAVGRARLYAQLRASEERFRTAFDAAPIGMVLLDTLLRPIRVNRAFARMLGYAATALPRADHSIHPADRLSMQADLIRLIGGEIPIVEREIRYLHREGNEIWGQVSASLVRDDTGNPLYVIVQIQDITERKALAEKLRHLALHDPLTGLANRTLFLERLTAALGRQPEDDEALIAVIYLDLDGFKQVNDLHGHEAGDQLLVVAARRLSAVVRPQDTVARFGGDEFTILLTGIRDADQALQVANRLVAALREPVALGLTQVRVGSCAGVALGAPGRTIPDDVLRQADRALYQAKATGNDEVAFYEIDAVITPVA